MKEDEIKEIFLAEALESQEELNKLFTELEKDHNNKKAIDAIFRITHTLKANAAGMGYEDIASMAHTLEDVFSEIRSGKLLIEDKIFNDLFRANDVFGAMIQQVKKPTPEPVRFKGIKTKLEVLLRVSRYGPNALPDAKAPDTEVVTPIKIRSVEDPKKAKKTNGKEVKHEQPVLEEVALALSGNDYLHEPEMHMQEIDNKVSFSDLVQIPVRKLDNLMNLVGELIIERDRVVTITGANGSGRNNEFSRLQRITSELQYSVMDVRLVQVNVLFNKFHRIVRDTAAIENKKINLTLEGTENEIDRNILQIISDSLVHIVRNAISHGIENKEERVAAHKPETGKVTIRAKSEKDAVVIDVIDDGKGIDVRIIKRKAIEKGLVTADIANLMSEDDIISFIFEPGFSSAEKVTAVSGRGVGMDVVKKAIDAIGGKINIKTELGKGSVFSLVLPSTMALKAALLFELGKASYAIPLSYTDAVIQLNSSNMHKVGKGLVATHLNKSISIVFLKDLFGMENINALNTGDILHKSFNTLTSNERLYIIVVSHGNRDIGFVVDRLLQQKEIVEKPLMPPLDNVEFLSGATILGDGNVCLVLDIPAIVSQVFRIARNSTASKSF